MSAEQTPTAAGGDTVPAPPASGSFARHGRDACTRPEAPDRPEPVQALLRGHGVDAPRARRVLELLSDGRPWRANELVRACGVAHAVVARVLEELVEAGQARQEADGTRLTGAVEGAGAVSPALADPVAHLVADHAPVLAELERAVAEGPASDLNLDHVAATADTALRRALFLATRFDLAGRTVLCVGDHDLTSVALKLLSPSTRAVVVDLDERVLSHIGSLAERLGSDISTHSADLRLGLPPALHGCGDVVLTDPPYTPDGVELFVRRGLEGMADPRRGRVLLAYGVSETTPRLASATQTRLLRLDLVVEALWPDFNRYHGAESIGAASDLYVLRPLSRSVPSPAGDDARVYSQGADAREARAGDDPARAEAVLARAAEGAGPQAPPPLLVGAWPKGYTGAGRVRLSTWMRAPGAAHAHALVDLTGGWGRLAPRAALAAPVGTGTVDVLVPSSSGWARDRSGQEVFRSLVEPRFSVRFLRGFGAGDLTCLRLVEVAPPTGEAGAEKAGAWEAGAEKVEATGKAGAEGPGSGGSGGVEADPAGALLAHVQRRAHGTLTSTLRAGLIEVRGRLGRPVNKRTARHAVAGAPGWVRGHTLLDLPEHRMRGLARVCGDLLAGLDQEGQEDRGDRESRG